MAVSTKELKGINEALEAKLKERGISDSDQLLEAALTPKQRSELASFVGVDRREILELANRADLARIKGVGGVYSDLLEQAGVDTVRELAARRPDNLHKKILDTNQAGGYAGQPPALAAVESWVEQAKVLPKTIEY